MKKNKSLLGLYLIVSLVLIVASVVLALTVGINFSTEIAGGTQIEVQVIDSNKTEDQIEKVEKALKENGLRAEKIFVEDKGTISNIVVRIAEKDLKADKVRASISNKTGNDLAEVSELHEFDGIVTNRALIWTSVAVVCLLLLMFLFGYFRYGIVGAISLMFTMLHSLILSVSMLIITRLTISFISLAIILSVLALVIFAMILILEKLRESVKQKHNENADIKDLIAEAKKETLKPLIALAVVLAVVCLAFVFVPVRLVWLSALAVLTVAVVGAYSFYFVGLSLHESLYRTKKLSEKAKLSKNVSPKPSK